MKACFCCFSSLHNKQERDRIGKIYNKRRRSGRNCWEEVQIYCHCFANRYRRRGITIYWKDKKKYWDARHNCFAFVIGSNNEIQRFSDDGEPQGTAGKPILETLLNENLHNTLIVVTRYFGGTLLGTGGLVRAYGQSSKEGIRNSVIQKVCEGISFKLTVDYNSIGKIKYIMGQMGITDAQEEYGQNVVLSILMKKMNIMNLIRK